jgi:hypothetical protein
MIFLSGNLAWLNFLTLVLAIPLLDDRVFNWIPSLHLPAMPAADPGLQLASTVLGGLIILMSIKPVLNMISPNQMMNFSFNPFHLAGTYGAFGSITRPRYEVVIEGTDEPYVTAASVWKEYEFKGKPGDPAYRPRQIAPYHLRIDWLMWFAALSNFQSHPWFVHFIAKLLEGDQAILSLLRSNPFPDRPPHYIRAEFYGYRFTTPEERKRTGQWWMREKVGSYFPPVSRDNPQLQAIMHDRGWAS